MRQSHNTGYRQAKETKYGETNRRKSERLDSTDEIGELHPGGVEGGKRDVGILTCYQETERMLRLPISLSTQR